MTLAKRLYQEYQHDEDYSYEKHSYELMYAQDSKVPLIKRMKKLEEHRLWCLKGWIDCDDDFNRLWYHRLESVARYQDGLRMLLEINISVTLL